MKIVWISFSASSKPIFHDQVYRKGNIMPCFMMMSCLL
uniref:Uncharacterized protein n=1 Tax=Rhizophora mucronata TaxID=61149 RepID=A0A2P2PYC2_RHIMU